MPRSTSLPLLATLPLLLASCSLNAKMTPQTALERESGGLYEGEGRGLTGRVPYRLTLTMQEQAGRANGVLTNLASGKVYMGSGTAHRELTGEGVALDMKFFENGNQYRAALHATWQGGDIKGQLKTVLLSQELLPYSITLKKVAGQ